MLSFEYLDVLWLLISYFFEFINIVLLYILDHSLCSYGKRGFYSANHILLPINWLVFGLPETRQTLQYLTWV